MLSYYNMHETTLPPPGISGLVCPFSQGQREGDICVVCNKFLELEVGLGSGLAPKILERIDRSIYWSQLTSH